MPLYEYKCEKCGSVTEVLQKISDPPMSTCLQCGGRLHKIISPPAIQFKGSGWYITDYAKKNKPDSDMSSPPSPKKPEKKSPPAEQKQAAKE